jgi:hypothetical protein
MGAAVLTGAAVAGVVLGADVALLTVGKNI